MLIACAAERASAQSTSLIAGGLTALPPVTNGPNLVQNGGFETLGGGLPAGWTGSSAWAMDQLVRHGGTFSYRRGTGAPTAAQTVQLRPGIYRLSAWVRTQSLGSSGTGVRLTLDFRPGGVNDWVPSEVISGTRDWTRVEVGPVVITANRTAAVQLESYNNPTGTAWFDDVELRQELPPAVDVFMKYPNFRGMLFDDQSQTLRFDVTVTPPGDDFGRHRVRTTLTDEASGATVNTQTFAAAASVEATLDGGGMQAGRAYLARVALVDAGTGAVVSTYPAYRVSRVPGSARASMNVSFDERNRVLVRGTPRFVLGLYDSGSSYSTSQAFWDNQLWSASGERRLSGINFNFYLNYWYGHATTEAMRSLMDSLQQHGVMYLQTANCFDSGAAAGASFAIDTSDSYVQSLGTHPGSAGVYTIDECKPALVPGAFTQYQRLKRLDPDSVTFAALLGGADVRLWRDAADLISTDPYPMYGAEPAGGYRHNQVADWTVNARDAVKDSRPFMTVLQFFQFTSQGRWPTRQEMRNHAYMAIVEGARGLWWWSLGDNALRNVCSGWCTQKTQYMDNLRAVVNELAALEPA
ncbi:MAG TPA: hypothetical protein VFX28_16160, partial [Methylomirabilota bacterium]|nr:hypothetical protein [Methylomirabilota bacterium]